MTSKWETVRLGDVFEPSSVRLGSYDEEPAVFAISKYDGIVLSSDYHERRVASAGLEKYKVVEPGDWAYSTIHIDEGSIARNSTSTTGVVSPMYTIMKWASAEHLPEYFELLLKSPAMLATYGDFAQGSINRRRSLPWKSFASLKISAPPLAEQRRIVDLIGALDDAIEAAEEHRDKVSDLISDVIARSQHGEDFIPLGKLADLQVGFAFKSETFSEHGVKLLRGDNIGHGSARWDDAKRIASEQIQEKMLAYDLQADDLVVAMDRPVISSGTKTALVSEEDLPAFLVQRVCRLRFDDAKVARSVLAVFQSTVFQRHVLSSQTGSHVPHITKKIIENFPIARRLIEGVHLNLINSSVDNKNLAESHVETLRSLRTELLSALLSGAHEIPESYDSVMELASA